MAGGAVGDGHPHTCRIRSSGSAEAVEALLASVKAICREHAGRTPLFVHVLLPEQEVVVRVKELSVDPDPAHGDESREPARRRAVYSSSMPDELEFEKPLLELENRIAELRASEDPQAARDEIARLEERLAAAPAEDLRRA